MRDSARGGFTNATDAADYLVGKGVPFRDAHGIVGQLVLMCIEKNTALDDLTLEEFRSESELFGEDIYEAISMRSCVDKRLTMGGPAPEAVREQILSGRAYLEET